MLEVFQRATRSALARLGESAVLRGTPTLWPVHMEQNVEVVDGQGNVVLARHVAMIDSADSPVVNDTLTVAGDDYRLDVLLADNGYSRRFILLKL